MPDPALALCGLSLARPRTVVYQPPGRAAVSRPVGPAVFALLSAVGRGPVTARWAMARVWGGPVAERRLRQLVSRANDALLATGCRCRLRTDRGKVLLSRN